LTHPLRFLNARGGRVHNLKKLAAGMGIPGTTSQLIAEDLRAPFINLDHVSEIPPFACRGCWICVCECPAQAIALRHTRDEQLNAAIDELLEQSLGRGCPDVIIDCNLPEI